MKNFQVRSWWPTDWLVFSFSQSSLSLSLSIFSFSQFSLPVFLSFFLSLAIFSLHFFATTTWPKNNSYSNLIANFLNYISRERKRERKRKREKERERKKEKRQRVNEHTLIFSVWKLWFSFLFLTPSLFPLLSFFLSLFFFHSLSFFFSLCLSSQSDSCLLSFFLHVPILSPWDAHLFFSFSLFLFPFSSLFLFLFFSFSLDSKNEIYL